MYLYSFHSLSFVYILQISNQMVTDVLFSHLITDYFPWKIEIQGTNVSAHVGERGTLKLKGLSFLTDLFINDARFDEKIKIELPSSLEMISINNTMCLDRHALEGLRQTKVPEKIISQYTQFI